MTFYFINYNIIIVQEEFEDTCTKGVIRICKSKDKQRSTKHVQDQVTRTD